MQTVSVLSVGCFVMGHVPYQLSLERSFADARYGIRFKSLHLPEVNRSDWLGRVVYQLLTWRPWRRTGSDWDYNRLRSELATSLFVRRLLQRTLPIGAPSVVHLHTQSISLLSADLLQWSPGVISMDCTTALLSPLHPHPAQRTYRPIIALERRSLSAAKHIVCWSEIVRRSVIDDYGIRAENVTVIRPAVRHARLPLRSSSCGSRSKLRLLFVGNDFERKGGHDLIAVFQQHLHSTCELDVVSGGVATLPVMAGLRLHRGLSSDSAALLQLYADADVFVMPTYEDAFGLVYVEAMAAGLPCIGSNVLAVPELVQHEVTGLIVEAGNREQLRRAVEKLRDYPELRATLATAAQAFARSECDEAKNCARLASIFRQVGQDIPSMSV